MSGGQPTPTRRASEGEVPLVLGKVTAFTRFRQTSSLARRAGMCRPLLWWRNSTQPRVRGHEVGKIMLICQRSACAARRVSGGLVVWSPDLKDQTPDHQLPDTLARRTRTQSSAGYYTRRMYMFSGHEEKRGERRGTRDEEVAEYIRRAEGDSRPVPAANKQKWQGRHRGGRSRLPSGTGSSAEKLSKLAPPGRRHLQNRQSE